jgi:cation diffusion facilitator CzcD-associated flavoprotein CzcO
VTGARIAIVGSGLASLVAHATLRAGGIAADEIAVYGDGDDPAGAWRSRAEAIRQTQMRSESDGHPFPRSFPGLAAREAARTLDPWPLLLSLADRYRPSVQTFLDSVERARERCGWDESLRAGRRISLVTLCHEGGFRLDGAGPFEHVLLALGHPGLAWPEERDERYVHAYEPHAFARRVAVLGAGMAAATEWRNARAAGAEVVSVRRREPVLRPLNLPRPLFTKRGLDDYRRGDRAMFLEAFSTPSYPRELHVDVPVARAVPADAEQVVCATGFLTGWRHDPLLAQLVAGHDLETAGPRLVLNDDATIPGLTDERRTLALAGVHAQWAFPAADTLAGMRWVAHRFLRRCRTR